MTPGFSFDGRRDGSDGGAPKFYVAEPQQEGMTMTEIVAGVLFGIEEIDDGTLHGIEEIDDGTLHG